VLDWLRILGSIVLVDLVLSGDNALVIGAVAAGIPPGRRWLAFLVGGGGAIVLRIVLTYSVTLLLAIPYLQACGGILLLFVTVRLLLGLRHKQKESDHPDGMIKHAGIKRFLTKHYLLAAMLTILLADLTTSLDNIIAIAALAQQDPILLVIGLLISVLLLLISSALIARLIERFSWVIVVAAMILAWTAAQMILQDADLSQIAQAIPSWWPILVYGAASITILFPGYLWLRDRYRLSSQQNDD
jgi:YjbE family integral membrane protein